MHHCWYAMPTTRRFWVQQLYFKWCHCPATTCSAPRRLLPWPTVSKGLLTRSHSSRESLGLRHSLLQSTSTRRRGGGDSAAFRSNREWQRSVQLHRARPTSVTSLNNGNGFADWTLGVISLAGLAPTDTVLFHAVWNNASDGAESFFLVGAPGQQRPGTRDFSAPWRRPPRGCRLAPSQEITASRKKRRGPRQRAFSIRGLHDQSIPRGNRLLGRT